MDEKARPESRPRRILVVDDEEFVTLTLAEGLERLSNAEVMVANGGEEALKLFSKEPFDLMITDYKMPGMDGLTLSTRVRELYPQTAIIMITAYSSDVSEEKAAGVRLSYLLEKPVRLSEIRSIASKVIEEVTT